MPAHVQVELIDGTGALITQAARCKGFTVRQQIVFHPKGKQPSCPIEHVASYNPSHGYWFKQITALEVGIVLFNFAIVLELAIATRYSSHS